ncbi:MAG: hypothetical protein ACI4SM_01480 [Candidatus Gastranaerophilaceae bacterium]
MTYKSIFQILTVLTIIGLACIFAIKPKMHTQILLYNSDYKLVKFEENTSTEKNIPTQKQTQTKSINTKKGEQLQQKAPVVTKKQEQKVIKSATLPKVTTQKTQKAQKETQKLTQKEEEILWNQWRSNLQNQIMKDTQLPIMPQGTVFKFSFTVDKYGKITNLKTWSLNSAYTPYAIEYIAPVIRHYQGLPILNFPAGSNRLTTNVTGGWVISSQERLSTPQDYNDSEKITK